MYTRAQIYPSATPSYSMAMTERLSAESAESARFKSIATDLLKNAQAIKANEKVREKAYSFTCLQGAYDQEVGFCSAPECDGGCGIICGTLMCPFVLFNYMLIGMAPDLVGAVVTLPLDYIEMRKSLALSQAEANEITLLQEYFSTYPTLEAFFSYENFILNHREDYARNDDHKAYLNRLNCTREIIELSVMPKFKKELIDKKGKICLRFEGKEPNIKIRKTDIKILSGLNLL